MAKRNLNEVLGFISRWGESEFSLRLLDEALTSAALAKKAILSNNPEEKKRLEARSLKRLEDEKKHEKLLNTLIKSKSGVKSVLDVAAAGEIARGEAKQRQYQRVIDEPTFLGKLKGLVPKGEGLMAAAKAGYRAGAGESRSRIDRAQKFIKKMTTSDEIEPKPTGSPEKPEPTGSPEKPEPSGSPEKPKPTGSPEKPEPTGSPEKPEPTGSPEKPEPTGSPEKLKQDSFRISRAAAAGGVLRSLIGGARSLGDAIFGPTASTLPGAADTVGSLIRAGQGAVRAVTGRVPVKVIDRLRNDNLLRYGRYKGSRHFNKSHLNTITS